MKHELHRYQIDLYARICGKTRFINIINADNIRIVNDTDSPYVALYAGDDALHGLLIATLSLVNNGWVALDDTDVETGDINGHIHHYRHTTNVDW